MIYKEILRTFSESKSTALPRRTYYYKAASQLTSYRDVGTGSKREPFPCAEPFRISRRLAKVSDAEMCQESERKGSQEMLDINVYD